MENGITDNLGDPRDNSSDAVSCSCLETNFYSKTESGDGNNFVKRSGDTMTGDFDMGQRRIKNMLTPMVDGEAAKKSWSTTP